MCFEVNYVLLLDCMGEGEHLCAEDTIDVLTRNLLGHPSITFHHHRTPSRESMLNQLAALQGRMDEERIRPIVHLESHGIDEGGGLVFPDGDVMNWKELEQPLRAINVASQNNLFLMLAACGGASAFTFFQPDMPAAIYGMIGPRPGISPLAEELRLRYRAFYETLFRSDLPGGDAALAAFADAWPDGRLRFFVRNAPQFVLEAARFAMEYPSFTANDFNSAKRLILMIDQFPELELRFLDVTFESAMDLDLPNDQ